MIHNDTSGAFKPTDRNISGKSISILFFNVTLQKLGLQRNRCKLQTTAFE